MSIQLPDHPSMTYGKVVGRFAEIGADATSDPDEIPDINAAVGMLVTFAPVQHMLKTDIAPPTWFLKKPVHGIVGTDGLLRLRGEFIERPPGILLPHGVYNVSYSNAAGAPKSHQIALTEEYTPENPYDLIVNHDYIAPPNTIQQLLSLPSGASPGMIFGWTERGLGWYDPTYVDDLNIVTGTVNLPVVEHGRLVGYRVVGQATFVGADFSEVTLMEGVYILEYSPTGWVVHQTVTGTPFKPVLFGDRFDAPDNTPLHGRTVFGKSWKDLQTDSIWAPPVATYAPTVISNGKINSLATKLRTGQVAVGASKFEVSADIVHDGNNPGSGERSLKLGIASNLHGALVTNVGGTWVEGAYLFYEGGAGFRLFAGNHVFPGQVGSAYTALGTGAVQANMALGWDGTNVYAKVNGTVVASGVPAGGALLGMAVAGYSIGLPANWSIDNFIVREV